MSWPVQEGSSDPVAKFFQEGSASYLVAHSSINMLMKDSHLALELEQELEAVSTRDQSGP